MVRYYVAQYYDNLENLRHYSIKGDKVFYKDKEVAKFDEKWELKDRPYVRTISIAPVKPAEYIEINFTIDKDGILV